MCVTLTLLIAFSYFLFFFFNDTATTEIYTLSLHDALPIFAPPPLKCRQIRGARREFPTLPNSHPPVVQISRSEEHTSELQSRFDLVCRLLLEKKKNNKIYLRMQLNRQYTNYIFLFYIRLSL